MQSDHHVAVKPLPLCHASDSSLLVEREPQPLCARIHTHFIRDVREDAVLEAELLLLAFATGIQDATSFPDYHCFASNQTGNTVLLAVGAVGTGGETFGIANIGLSLAMFVLGGFLLGRVGNVVGCHRRWWLVLSSAVQTAMVFAACGIQYVKGVTAFSSPASLGAIALLAFSSGGQVAMAKSLQMSEITTAMATAAYVDVLIDPRMFQSPNRPRNRRVLFLLSLLAGSFVGALAYLKLGSLAALLISAVGKLVVTFALCFNGRSEQEETEKRVIDLGRSI